MATRPTPPLDVSERPATAPPQEPAGRARPLPSHTLLQGRRFVEIDHNGEVYRLQATRLGKLILTK